MRYLREDDPQWPTALEALRDGYDNRKLTELSRAFVGKKPPTRKDEMVAALLRLMDAENLPELWKKLSPLEQSAAAETAWSRDGRFKDVGYIPPAGARPDYGGLWGTDDLAFLSQYDGLQYMRITASGAWCMGLREDYAPPAPDVRNILEIRPEREVIAIAPLTAADRMMLDTFGQSTGPDTWELDGLKILTAASEGRKIAELASFLESASGTALPNPTADFLHDLEQRLGMFRDEGPARLVHCESSDLATALTTDPATAKICYRVDEHLLAVPARSDAAFRKALGKYGFVLVPRLFDDKERSRD